MQVTFLGHAGMRIDAPELRLVLDPWLSRRGAFFGSWFQFPRNDHLDGEAVLDCDWVTVSHDHLDHLDMDTLRRLPASATVLIPSYQSANLRRRLAEAGVARVLEVGAWERHRLNDEGDWLTFIPEEAPMCQDAAVLVSAGGASVLHCNDARLTQAQGRKAVIELGAPIDVMAVQTSGASWHPICYEYPTDVITQISAQKRLAKFRAVRGLVRAVKPVLAVPFAGPPCFLDPALAHHNRSIPAPGVFPDQAQAAHWLAGHLPGQDVRHFLPGDVWEPRAERYRPDPAWQGFSYGTDPPDGGAGGSFEILEAYLDGYRHARQPEIDALYAAHPEPGPDFGERFAEHIARLGELSPWFLEQIDMTVRFEIGGPGGGRWDAKFAPGGARVDLMGRAASVNYRFAVDGRWLVPVVDGRAGWEDLLLSLRVSAWRDPDVYNDYLIGLLKHADAHVLRAVEAYETAEREHETVVIEANGSRYEVSRYCPHAGEDLGLGAVVVDGVLRCLGHNYEFDLETGACVNARCQPIKSHCLETLSSL